MFISINLGCINMALIPDVCKTPAVPAPVPLPYPNMALSSMHIPAQYKVMIGAGLIETEAFAGTTSELDEPGSLGGVVSGVFKGPDRYLLGSLKLAVCGFFVMRLTSLTGHNGMPFNTMGMQVSPAQFKVVALS
jgi:hypothetical protein